MFFNSVSDSNRALEIWADQSPRGMVELERRKHIMLMRSLCYLVDLFGSSDGGGLAELM